MRPGHWTSWLGYRLQLGVRSAAEPISFRYGASTIGATIGLANANYLMTENASIMAGNKAYRSYVKEQDKREKETKRRLRNAVKTYTVEGY